MTFNSPNTPSKSRTTACNTTMPRTLPRGVVLQDYDTMTGWLKQHRNVRMVISYTRDGCWVKTYTHGTISLRIHLGVLTASHNGKTATGKFPVKNFLHKVLK